MESLIYSIVLQDMFWLIPTSPDYLLIFKLGKGRKLTLLKSAIDDDQCVSYTFKGSYQAKAK